MLQGVLKQAGIGRKSCIEVILHIRWSRLSANYFFKVISDNNTIHSKGKANLPFPY